MQLDVQVEAAEVGRAESVEGERGGQPHGQLSGIVAPGSQGLGGTACWEHHRRAPDRACGAEAKLNRALTTSVAMTLGSDRHRLKHVLDGVTG